MRSAKLLFALPFVVVSCSESRPDTATTTPDAGPPEAGVPDAADEPEAAPPEPPVGPPLGPAPDPVELTEDAVIVMGVTSDGWVVYRSSKGVSAIPADGSATEPTLVSEKLGMVHVRGKTVFVYSDVDWAARRGTLTIWSAAHGPQAVGPAVYTEDAGYASEDGAWIAWLALPPDATAGDAGTADGGAADAGTTDAGVDGGPDAGGGSEAGDAAPAPSNAELIIAAPDLASPMTALPKVGFGPGTCTPRLGFVGSRMIAAWCDAGTDAAKLMRLEAPSFEPVTLASGITAAWSADATGERVFYTDASGGAFVAGVASSPVKLDHGVGWGTLVPDGSAALYVVADQLRRSPLPVVDPTPIVTTGFVARAAMSPDMVHALYSTKVTYNGPVLRDLLITPTAGLNLEPQRVLDEPVAELSRSAFTRDSQWVLFAVADEQGKKRLHARWIHAAHERTADGVDTIVAAHGSRVVYSANRSGPETYPITADLAVIDPVAQGEPVVLRTGTTDGRNFALSADGKSIFYVMPGEGETPSRLYAQGIP